MSIGTNHSQKGRMQSGDRTVMGGGTMPLVPAAQTALDKWIAMFAKSDFSDLPSIIAADAVFRSPVEWTTYPGRDLVCLLVRTGAEVYEDFKYHRQFVGGEGAVLEFSAHIGEVELQAVHLIRFNAAGEIVEIDLMMRPAKGVTALGNGMGSRIGPQVKAALAAAQRHP